MWYGQSATISATVHSKKPYRSHRKSISATTVSAKTISATEFIWRHRVDTSVFRVVRNPYLEFERHVFKPANILLLYRKTAHSLSKVV